MIIKWNRRLGRGKDRDAQGNGHKNPNEAAFDSSVSHGWLRGKRLKFSPSRSELSRVLRLFTSSARPWRTLWVNREPR